MSDLSAINSYLQRSPPLIQDGFLDLSFLKTAAAILPDRIKAGASAKETLDLLSAIVFHTAFPLTVAITKEWFDEHGFESGDRQQTTEEQLEAVNLLKSLGLVKPLDESVRRV